MSPKAVTGIFALVFIAISVGFALWVFSIDKKTSQKIDSVSASKAKTIDVDSLRDVIEAKIIDSMKVLLSDQDRKIIDLTKRMNTNRRQYESLKERVDNIPVDMPDF